VPRAFITSYEEAAPTPLSAVAAQMPKPESADAIFGALRCISTSKPETSSPRDSGPRVTTFQRLKATHRRHCLDQIAS
jgi:hypothetical protein